MGQLFANLAGGHIAGNVGGWRVGQNIGATEPRTPGYAAAHSTTTPAEEIEKPVTPPVAPIESRIETGEVALQQVKNVGSEITDVAFGHDRALDDLAQQAKQLAGEIAS